MRHIFVVHNNIACIAIYETVQKLLANSESIIILTYRNSQWPYKTNNIDIVNLSELYKNFYSYSPKSVLKIVKRVLYERLLQVWISKKIINNRDFVLYLPAFTLNFCAYLAKHKNCIGYYFVEEGTMAYVTKPKVGDNRSVFNYILETILGIYKLENYSVLENFVGTISISEKAFEWNYCFKIINSHLGEETFPNITNVDNIIVTGHLTEKMSILKDNLSKLIKFINQKQQKKTAIKFHPAAYFSFPEKITELESYIRRVNSVETIILPPSFIVEYAIIKNKCVIYSFETFSSLNLYSVMWNSRSYLLSDGNISEFLKIDDCINFFKAERNG